MNESAEIFTDKMDVAAELFPVGGAPGERVNALPAAGGITLDQL
jgi:hypothetical protein